MRVAGKGRKDRELRILHYGAVSLRRPAAWVKRITPDLKTLASKMQTLMQQAEGIGLAASQVGVEKQLAVVDLGEGPVVLVNPRLIKADGEEVLVEGCLSLPGLYGEVKRASRVIVAATDLSGRPVRIRAEGLLARALQHEIDHLQGRLFIDRVDESTLHWLVYPPARRPTGAPSLAEGQHADREGEPLRQPTTLQEALRVFLSRPPSASSDR